MSRIPPIRSTPQAERNILPPTPPDPSDQTIAEMRALRQQLAARDARDDARREAARYNRRGNTQGAGCLLVLVAMALGVFGVPVAGIFAPVLALPLFVAGVVILLVGFCL